MLYRAWGGQGTTHRNRDTTLKDEGRAGLNVALCKTHEDGQRSGKKTACGTHLRLHLSVRARDDVVALTHAVCEPLDLALRVAVDDRLVDGQRLVQVAEGHEPPRLLLELDVELLDTFQRDLARQTRT